MEYENPTNSDLLGEFYAAAREVLSERLVRHDVRTWGCRGFSNPLTGSDCVVIASCLDAAVQTEEKT